MLELEQAYVALSTYVGNMQRTVHPLRTRVHALYACAVLAAHRTMHIIRPTGVDPLKLTPIIRPLVTCVHMVSSVCTQLTCVRAGILFDTYCTRSRRAYNACRRRHSIATANNSTKVDVEFSGDDAAAAD
jgi:hypothetical protein